MMMMMMGQSVAFLYLFIITIIFLTDLQSFSVFTKPKSSDWQLKRHRGQRSPSRRADANANHRLAVS